jgi:hypothetical protein
MFSRLFLIDLAERAVSTAAESALLALGAEQLNVLEADWKVIAGFALGGAVLSVLKGLAASRTEPAGSAALF